MATTSHPTTERRTELDALRVLVVLHGTGGGGHRPDPSGAGQEGCDQRAATVRADDAVGLWGFSTRQNGDLDYRELVPIRPVSSVGPDLKQQINDLIPDGGTGLYDTVLAAFEKMKGARDPDAINAVVFLTDGKNEKNGGISLENLLPSLQPTGENDVRLFTIGYGDDADQGTLKNIAETSDGANYDSSRPDAIDQVFTAVISNF